MNQKENIQLPSKPIQANMDLLAQREVVGLGKYGVTLGDAKLSHAALLQHGLEEALDLANYLQTALSAERESANWHDEHRKLFKKLQDFSRRIRSPGYDGADTTSDFIELLHQYSIEACRRGVWVTP